VIVEAGVPSAEVRRRNKQRAGGASGAVVVPEGAPRATPSIWKSGGVRVPQNWRLEWAFPAAAAHPEDRKYDLRDAGGDDEQQLLLLLRGAARRALASAIPPLTPDQTNELAGIMASFSRWVLSQSQSQGQHHHRHHRHHRQHQHRAVLRFDASRGKRATKCPKWHYDSVPFRWIQSLVGPGVDVVTDPGAVDWSYLLDPDRTELSAAAHNRRAVRDRSARAVGSRLSSSVSGAAVARSVPEGDAVVLLGGGWSAWIRTPPFSSPPGAARPQGAAGVAASAAPASVARPAVHKSPALLFPWQERVLISIDLVDDDSGGGGQSPPPA
jgi:hypothetical protein